MELLPEEIVRTIARLGRRIHILVGAAIWVGVGIAAALGAFTPKGEAGEALDRVVEFALNSPLPLEVSLPDGSDLRAGDPVFVSDPDRFLRAVGRVREVTDGVATIAVFPHHARLLVRGTRAEVYAVPDTVGWIVDTLVPPGKAAEIRRMAADFFRDEGRAIRETLMPEVHRTFADVVALYRDELPAALERHEKEIRAIARRHEEGVVREELTPVLREEGGRIAAEKFRPLAETVGRELLEELPVWSLGWRYLWQKVPFTDDDQVRVRFQEYLREKAEPILERHTEEAVALAGEVARELVVHPRICEAVGRVAGAVVADPEVADLAKRLFDELVLENDRLREVIRRRWTDGLGDAVAHAAARAEPLMKRIVDAVVRSDAGKGLAPRFSHVLRTRVFWKDRRWIRLVPGAGPRLPEGARIAGERPDE